MKSLGEIVRPALAVLALSGAACVDETPQTLKEGDAKGTASKAMEVLETVPATPPSARRFDPCLEIIGKAPKSCEIRTLSL